MTWLLWEWNLCNLREYLLFKQLREYQHCCPSLTSFTGSRWKITGAAKWLWILFSPLSKSIKLYFHSLVIIAEKSSEWKEGARGRNRTPNVYKWNLKIDFHLRRFVWLLSVSLVSSTVALAFFRMEIQMRDSVLIECFYYFYLLCFLAALCALLSSERVFNVSPDDRLILTATLTNGNEIQWALI